MPGTMMYTFEILDLDSDKELTLLVCADDLKQAMKKAQNLLYLMPRVDDIKIYYNSEKIIVTRQFPDPKA